MRIFTWRDIEVDIMKNKSLWPANWNRVDVYNDEIVVNIDTAENNSEKNNAFFTEIFGRLFDGKSILIEFDEVKIDIIYEQGDDSDRASKKSAPLFKDMYLASDAEPFDNDQKLPGVPIVAFHSYKGGVGRTLSLIAMAKAIAEKFGEKKKVLIIDADIEAPGLTWMMKEEIPNPPISYLDILSLLHFHEISNELLMNTSKLVKRSEFTIETDLLETEHYFLPVYRIQDQMLDIYSSPEKVIAVHDNKYVITEFISSLGKIVGADLVLVDLRAGVTEFSAPYLFDSRVIKYFITSTSMQSLKGMQLILDEIVQKTLSDLLDSKILLTMIPRDMDETTIAHLEDELIGHVEATEDHEQSTFLRESYMVRILFDQSLISLGNFRQICYLLNGNELTKKMSEIMSDLFQTGETKNILPPDDVRRTLQTLNSIASAEITAEGNASANMLSTSSIKEIIKNHRDTVPQIVVQGAKGSGKTYIYKQMLATQSWEAFSSLVDKEGSSCQQDTYFLPLLLPLNMRFLDGLSKDCIKKINTVWGEERIAANSPQLNYTKVSEYISQDFSQPEWTKRWMELVTKTIGNEFKSLAEADEFLYMRNKKLVFLVDGLEDIAGDIQGLNQNGWRRALRALCQNFINELRGLKFGHIGIIVFIRKDMMEDAIEINFNQFSNQYLNYELNWTQTEALRLALWIAAKANTDLAAGIDILKSSRGVLEERLELLWGRKLGKADSKEAYSSRWIIAALSDFNGQLQARDIVRFLMFSTRSPLETKLIYNDRYIMPVEIRQAIPECSKQKLSEIETEMKATYAILDKFANMEESEKQLPLTLEKIRLTGEEIAKLESQGYLKISDKKYYLPEIIRSALGFVYKSGARPKVLSLLVQ